MPSKPGLSISVSLKLQSRCLPSLGMNWSEPSSVSWSSVKMSTMLGLELGFEFGLLRILIMSPLSKSKRVNAGLLLQGCVSLPLPSGLVDKLSIWWLTGAGKATAWATRSPWVIQLKNETFSRICTWLWTRWRGRGRKRPDWPWSRDSHCPWFSHESARHLTIEGRLGSVFRSSWFALYKRCQKSRGHLQCNGGLLDLQANTLRWQ